MTHVSPPMTPSTVLPAALSASPALTRIHHRGMLKAGTSAGIKGLSVHTDDGCKGMDADFGRALSAVIFADHRPVAFEIVNPDERFSALAAESIDIGLYNASKTLSRELQNAVTFPVVTLVDGEAVLTQRHNAEKTFSTWQDLVIAVQGGTTSAGNIDAYRSGRPATIRPFETLADAVSALVSGDVDAVVFDAIGLAGVLSDLEDPQQLVILDERISRELMGPVVPVEDPIFARLVEWTFAALVRATELGVTADRVTDTACTARQDAFLAAGLPLWPRDPMAAQRLRAMLQSTGNYQEIFDRNLGRFSDLKLPRGLNAPSADGGIFHPAPF
ncbi:general L-amino acid transport system substrate-binding protein [Roseibium hamelinense]|uniref:General L-amino acid transport system substrate-binding protein n=1 Tax=Roseibium hamelinense TaxID=150831 RepID=A0A562TH44_9HYPH|nr:transporter substrate-binding domain-containing protein [Roseibium hamelinense]MTI46144.1 transporter substrate-binding domain-containing protein [Roseibium hamelinense]TWI92663.1 general L-amino acid transport system substrate-binding protein [Roseibium hamelinense]